MTQTLESVLAICAVLLVVFICYLAVHVCFFLKELRLTLISVRGLTDLAQKEIEPALKKLNNILTTVDNVSTATNKQIEFVKKVLTTALGASYLAFSGFKKKGFIGGLVSGFNLIRKKGDK